MLVPVKCEMYSYIIMNSDVLKNIAETVVEIH